MFVAERRPDRKASFVRVVAGNGKVAASVASRAAPAAAPAVAPAVPAAVPTSPVVVSARVLAPRWAVSVARSAPER